MGFRNHGLDGPTFQMREKIFAVGDDFWIEDAAGNKVFKVDGKALRARETFILEDAHGNEVSKIQEKKLTLRDKMEIEAGGRTVATIKKALISPLRDRFSIELEGGGELSAKGNVVDHEYEIERDGEKVAEVSKKWFRVADTYGVEMEPDQDPVIVLAATVALDMMAHQHR